MTKKVNEVVQRINSWYVGDDCAMLMIPYRNAITILDKDGIQYHHKVNVASSYTNKYESDERRKNFPYYNIPIHCTRIPFNGKYIYTNQLFNFEQPYLRINDGHIIESVVVKDKDEALAISKLMPISKSTSYKTRDELEKMLSELTSENEKLYYVYLSGSLPENNELIIPTEDKIFDHMKTLINKDIEIFDKLMDVDPSSALINFMKLNFDKIDLSCCKFNVPIQMLSGSTVLLVRCNGENISITGVDIYFVSSDYYKVDTYNIPVTKYTLMQLRSFASEIRRTKEPRITMKDNPYLTREDIQKGKEMIRKFKK